MKKLLFCIIGLLLLFFFRDGLNEYWIEHFGPKTDESSWLVNGRNSIATDLSGSDFAISIEHLITFKDKIEKELQRIKSSNTESSRKHRGKLVCELSVVYKKMAMLYLQNGDEELYMQFIGKSQAELAECADLNNSNNSM